MIDIAIRTALSTAGSFLSGIPWQVWAGLAVVIVPPVSYCMGDSNGYDRGREEVLTELREQEAKAKDKAIEARASADDKAQERATEFEAEQEMLGEIIEKAEAEGGNALDGLFGG